MISLCMIVKDEEANLEKCLNSVRKYVNEIIIVDTGSKDKTKYIAKQFTDKVFDFKWCNNFSEARNFSILHASNDWILVLDADEEVIEFNINDFFNNIKDKKTVGRIEIQSTYDDIYGVKRSKERISRFFNKKYFRYEGIIHEQIVPILSEHFSTVSLDICVNHLGYRKEEVDKKNKVTRNISLLELAIEEDPNDAYLLYQLGKAHYMDKNYNSACSLFEKALSLNPKTELEYVENLIEMYGYSLINTNRYSEALKLQKYCVYFSGSPDYVFLMGIIYMNNGKLEDAVKSFENCIGEVKGKVEGINSFLPLYNIGVILECIELKEDAVKYYSMCGNYQPANARLKDLLQ